MKASRSPRLQMVGIAAMVCITCLTGCQAPTPRRGIQAQGGILMSQPSLKFNGKVGDKQYEAFELGPISHRIGANVVITTATMSGSEFSVVGPKMEPVLNGMTLIHEALRGCDVKSADGNAAFRKNLQSLFIVHKNEVKGVMVTQGGVVMDLK